MSKVRSWVDTMNVAKACLKTHQSVCQSLGVQAQDFTDGFAALATAWDMLPVLQLLVRPLQPGEDLPKLAAICYKTIKPHRINPAILAALEKLIPIVTLVSLTAAASVAQD